MSSKGDVYQIVIPFSAEENESVQDLLFAVNRVLAKIEDRFDDIEAIRGSQYFTTTRWEKDYV